MLFSCVFPDGNVSQNVCIINCSWFHPLLSFSILTSIAGLVLLWVLRPLIDAIALLPTTPQDMTLMTGMSTWVYSPDHVIAIVLRGWRSLYVYFTYIIVKSGLSICWKCHQCPSFHAMMRSRQRHWSQRWPGNSPKNWACVKNPSSQKIWPRVSTKQYDQYAK
jgi:hypothetical protein